MIDTHCHLDVAAFDADRPAALERAWAAGLRHIVVPGISPRTWESLLALPQLDSRLHVALGIHPQLLAELDPTDDERHLTALDALLARQGAIAIGECGLDGPTQASVSIDRQLAVFSAHVALAHKHRLPLLVHCYRAHPHLIRFFKSNPIPERGLLLHSYSGSAELVPFYAQAKCHFSFSGPVTFPEARRPLEALRAVADDRLMAETDAPDQAPHPHRGKRCEPAHLPLILDAMARARCQDGEALRALTAANARRFFGPTLDGCGQTTSG